MWAAFVYINELSRQNHHFEDNCHMLEDSQQEKQYDY